MTPSLSKVTFILLMLLGAFWETLSLLGSKGEFCPVHFEANSERLVMLAPIFVLLWLTRHVMPPSVSQRHNRTFPNKLSK